MYLLNLLISNVLNDTCVNCVFIFYLISCILLFFVKEFVGILALISFIWGCIVCFALLLNSKKIENVALRIRLICSRPYNSGKLDKTSHNCHICNVKLCQRHKNFELKDSKLIIDKKLDKAIESIYTKIISSFIQSWFDVLCHDEDFVQTLKQHLKDVSSHIIGKFGLIDWPKFITEKLCPIVFKHYQIVQTILEERVSMNKLPTIYSITSNAIHPAVSNRQSEKDYLRAVSKCLIPKIFNSENFDSKIFFSLIRELMACWVLLPLMDVICDPNMINLFIYVGLSKSKNDKLPKLYENSEKAEFLKNFVDNCINSVVTDRDPSILTDNNKLYAFMQYLKKRNTVDVLKFYLDVDNLNKELCTLKNTNNQKKQTSLQQESEKLMKDFEYLIHSEKIRSSNVLVSLTEAQDIVKNLLEQKLRRAFSKTKEYFKMIYGSRKIEFIDKMNQDQNTGVSKLRYKIKGAFKTNLDGITYEAAEIPTVWDALAEPNTQNLTIYNSVTQKLRRERGQNLDSFLLIFISSLDNNTDFGEDVSLVGSTTNKISELYSKKDTSIYGDIFGFHKDSRNFLVSSYLQFKIIGPSRSFLYTAYLFKLPSFFLKLAYSLIRWSEKLIDMFLCVIIKKIITMGLHQPRLAVLIQLLENTLFNNQRLSATPDEILERQQRAKHELDIRIKGSGRLLEILQSPTLNKHLMYCVFDAVISELYPELKS